MWGVMCSRFKLIFAFVGCALLNSCAQNAFRDFAAKSSISYLIDSTKKQLDEQDFDTAISTITAALALEPTNEEAVFLAAIAYAGRAGLRTLDLFLTLASDISSKSIFTIFAQNFKGAEEADLDDMDEAIRILESLGNRAALRTNSLNFLAMFLYYSRIGIILNLYGFDADAVLRTNFTACKKSEDFSGLKTGIPDAYIDKVMISLARVQDTSGSISGSGSGFSALRSSTGATSFPFDPIPCSTASDPVDFAKCVAVRVLINVGAPTGIGLGSGSDSTTFPESPGGVCDPSALID
jgi:hypothetical protein